MVTSLQAEKWRQDEKKILEMMHFGFSVVVPENQKFYLRQDIATEVIPLDQALRDKNKILIMSGEYFHKNQIVFDESKNILAEPGTVINVELNNRWQKIFAMNDWQDDELDRPTVEIENVTINLSWQSMSIYRELFSHIKRRIKRIIWRPQMVHEESRSLFTFRNVSVKVPSLRHWFNAIGSSTLSLSVIVTIMRLMGKRKVTPVQIVLSPLSLGLVSGYSVGTYIKSSSIVTYLP